ncbi:response regulator transcription factor [Treponema sp.]
MKARVLIVEDEVELAELSGLYLDREGIDSVLVQSAEAAKVVLSKEAFDLILLDINLPGMDGFEFLQELRRTISTPVIIVSARETDEDVITGLSMGADEFVSKPVSPRVLAARVRALLRRERSYTKDNSPNRSYRFRDFTLDFDACLLKKDGKRVPLSAREFDVLAFLVENSGKAFSPQEIYQAVWGQSYGDPTTVGVYIQRLRKKIEAHAHEPEIIETVKGKGYRFES